MSAYIRRSERLIDLAQKGGIDAVIVSGMPNMRYFSGFTGDSGMLIVSQSGRHLLSDFRYTEQAHSQAPDFEYMEFARGSQYKLCGDILKSLGAKRVGFEEGEVSFAQYLEMRSACGTDLTGVDNEINSIRSIKDEAELDKIKNACKIADSAFEKILSSISPGANEIDIALELEFVMRKQGAQGISFSPIVASGPHGSLPHAIPTNRKIASGDLVTLDFGCIADGYCSDMTRTIAVGKVAQEHVNVYNICLEAQRKAANGVKPGMTGRESDALARSLIEAAGFGERFGHGLGHGVGIQVHEEPRLSPQSDTRLLEGMVFSIEPGIYLNSKMGVRIEDIGVLRADGFESFCSSPKELIVL